LPAWSGCRTLTHEQVFLLGDNPRSFDGRYFGPTVAADVLGPVRILFQPDAG
jgi:type IV secretory pathway protease TraF